MTNPDSPYAADPASDLPSDGSDGAASPRDAAADADLDAAGPGREPGQSRAERIDFPCGNCGARMHWDPESDALSCEYCGHRLEVPRGMGTIEEYDLESAGSAARGFGIEMRVSECKTCGARVAFEESRTSTACVFCGSNHVLLQGENRNAIRPESVVPMDLGAQAARENFQKWIAGLWFRPNALKRTRRFDAVGVYVPYWTFDCRVTSKWSADSGTYYYVRVPRMTSVNGRRRVVMRRERRVRWKPAWGSRRDAYDDILVNASKAVPEKLAADIGGFDTGALVPYDPGYLAGWFAEEYQVDLEEGWVRGKQHVESMQHSRCARDVPGDTHRSLRVQNRIEESRWKHVLLPVWSLTYTYNGKTYPVLINGQSGIIKGKAPLSWLKILGLIAAIAVGGLVLFGIATLFGGGVWLTL